MNGKAAATLHVLVCILVRMCENTRSKKMFTRLVDSSCRGSEKQQLSWRLVNPCDLGLIRVAHFDLIWNSEK